MTKALLRTLHPLGPVGAQGLAQAVNLAAQLSLLALLGRAGFGDLVLGLLAATSVAFLGEMGFGSYFLRQSASPRDWLSPWREAVVFRLLALTVLGGLAWHVLGAAAPDPAVSRRVLLAALPGLAATAVNPLPLLFGLGHTRLASASVVARAVVQAVAGVGGALLWPAAADLLLGLGFSAGILLQVVCGRLAGLPAAVLLPRRPRAMPPFPALRLWGLSLVGILSDRALPFLVSDLRPQVLAPALIVVQVLQAMAGIVAQVDRVLVPATVRGADPVLTWRMLRAPLAVLAALMCLALPMLAWLFLPGQHWAALLLALEWSMMMTSALTFPLTFAVGREGTAAAFMLGAVPFSILAQVALGAWQGLEPVLALRVAVAATLAWLTIRSLETRRVS
ncbi:hypothetical protein [Magnetospirillum sp. 64-120]|uniref:hypothetical protein n=1 Tax=Magnetospirillum sp. 64-120 TaxID=1895778 RepID=UPI00092C363E|nr:hypothetical protein [Magnetospirillum sp. 64-120]OJX67160.1 MAG: hypothetical protein BGO92_01110 [Magnetospirillum sp. 64-120]